MRLELDFQNAKLILSVADQEFHALFELLSQILHFDPVKKEIKSAIQRGDISIEEKKSREPEAIVKPDSAPKIDLTGKPPVIPFPGYTGFLYIRCPGCGEERGFCSKYPITDAICKKCGKRIHLPEELARVSFRCECGRTYRYLTNITDPMFDIPCMECGTPNAVVLNHKTGSYIDAKKGRGPR